MIWNYIRDFIVQYITGGTNSLGDTFNCFVGANDYDNYFSTSDFYVKCGNFTGGGEEWLQYITLGDWLATTLTIICMCLIVVFAIWLVRFVFKLVSSAFLLRR